MGRPIRIVVIGPSVGYFVRPPRARLEDGNYGEVLERLLAEAGVPAEVTNSCGWWLLVHEAFRDIESRVLLHNPDIVITNFGMGECEPKIIPTAVLKWIYTWRPKGDALTVALRRLFVRPIGWLYMTLSPRLIRILPVPRRLGARRFEAELRRFVRVVRKERKALVLMLNANPPGPRVEETLPGTHTGAREYNAIMERVAAEEGGEVRVMDVYSLVLREGIDGVLPDGLQYSALGHRIVAEMLATEVRAWAAERPRVN
jgi:hypothetical protein